MRSCETHAAISVLVLNSTNVLIYFFHVRLKYVAIFVCAVVRFSIYSSASFSFSEKWSDIVLLNVNKDLACQSVKNEDDVNRGNTNEMKI